MHWYELTPRGFRLQRTPLGHFQLYLKGLGPDALTVSRRHVAGVRKLMHSL